MVIRITQYSIVMTKLLPRSRVTSKFQATIPQPVREALGIEQGDLIVFEVRDGEASIRKVPRVDVEYLKAVSATLSEWDSADDEQAYCEL